MTVAISSKEKENGQFSTEQARQLIEDETRKRAETCLAAINEILKDHSCELICFGQLRSGAWVPITDGPFAAGSARVSPH